MKSYESAEAQLLEDDLESVLNEMMDFSEYLLDLANTRKEKLRKGINELKMISERLQKCIEKLDGE
jgi:hypothetical protein